MQKIEELTELVTALSVRMVAIREEQSAKEAGLQGTSEFARTGDHGARLP